MEKYGTTAMAATDVKPEIPYEAPKVETVLTADDLEREALYAGASQIL